MRSGAARATRWRSRSVAASAARSVAAQIREPRESAAGVADVDGDGGGASGGTWSLPSPCVVDSGVPALGPGAGAKDGLALALGLATALALGSGLAPGGSACASIADGRSSSASSPATLETMRSRPSPVACTLSVDGVSAASERAYAGVATATTAGVPAACDAIFGAGCSVPVAPHERAFNSSAKRGSSATGSSIALIGPTMLNSAAASDSVATAKRARFDIPRVPAIARRAGTRSLRRCP